MVKFEPIIKNDDINKKIYGFHLFWCFNRHFEWQFLCFAQKLVKINQKFIKMVEKDQKLVYLMGFQNCPLIGIWFCWWILNWMDFGVRSCWYPNLHCRQFNSEGRIPLAYVEGFHHKVSMIQFSKCLSSILMKIVRPWLFIVM